jgi:hypothetical protein
MKPFIRCKGNARERCANDAVEVVYFWTDYPEAESWPVCREHAEEALSWGNLRCITDLEGNVTKKFE